MATDFIRFKEGQDYLHTHGNGLPTTVYFLLSTKSCNAAGGSGQFTDSDTLAVTGMGEITGTGYARQSQAAPTPSGGLISFTAKTWNTGAAVDWPATVRACVAVTSPDNTGKALWAWNLQAGGGARDMSAASTSEQFTPTVTTSS